MDTSHKLWLVLMTIATVYFVYKVLKASPYSTREHRFKNGVGTTVLDDDYRERD